MMDPALSDWGLYIHIPFCQARCTYCDFNTITGMGEDDYRRYVSALIKEWDQQIEIPAGNLVSIFLGGGTPSLLEPALVASILEAVAKRLPLSGQSIEITMEANPGTVNVKRLRQYRMAGVNRLSLGVQAWQNHHLQQLNRIHTAQDARIAMESAREAGFENVNCDLIYGLPQQSLVEWQESLEAVLALKPDHLSLYQLQIEEGTPLATQLKRGLLSLPATDLTADMADIGRMTLLRAGFVPYEISNYCLPGKHSRHNRLYWTMNPYLALGAGAHGYWHGRRWWNIRGIRRYMEAIEAGENVKAGEEWLDRQEEMREYVWLGLREEGGFSRTRFHHKFGVNPEGLLGSVFRRLHNQGLIERDKDRIRLTSRGRDMANYVFREFVGTDQYA